MLDIGEHGTRGLVTIADSLPEGASLGDAAQAFNAIYSQGRKGKTFSAVKFGELLSPEQRQYAYQTGVVDGMMDSARAKNVAAEISKENDGKVLQKDGGSGTIETATVDTSPKRKGRTAEERQEARKRQIEAERRRFSQLSPERQKYLKEKYSEYRNVIEKLEVGDKLISDNGDTIGEVKSISDGIVFIVGEDGFIEMILPDTFIADGVISFLDIGDGHFEKPDGTWIGGSKNNAIWQYKSSESYKINEAIRSGRELSEDEAKFIEDLDYELSRVPKYNGVVYRNMTFDFQGQEELDDFVNRHSVGSIVTYPAYTSTSKSKEGYIVEGELLVHLEIYGENGHDVSKGYGIEEEQEVLFDRNTDFYVSSVSYDGKTANIVLEEVVYGEKEVSESDKGNNSAQQGYGSQGGASEVQRMQTSKQMDVQKVSRRNSKGDSSQRDNLQGVREEVISDSDVQQAKSDRASSSEWSAERIKDGKVEKAKPISEIIEQIRHDFGINITKGHVRGKGVLGQYSRKNHGIRTKIANDLPTVAHELGHALDQRYGLTDKSKLTKEMRSELINALGDLKDSYKQNLWVSEGFAEYIRRFLQNRDEAARSYPEFTKHFLNSLSKTDRVLMDTFADEINAYYALDADTATSSIRLREEGTPDARTPLEKAREMGDDIYQAWVDANHGIRLFDEATGSNAYKLASNAAYSDAIAGQIITGDLTDANGQYVAPGLKAALEGVNIGDKKIYREFGEYLVVRHGPERLKEGMMIFADARKNTASFMAKRAAELEAAHPEFKEAADRLYEFQRQFLKTWAVDTGLLPSEVAEAWAKRWSFYVPLNRAVGKAGRIGAKRGYANQNSTVKKAIGSGLDIVHPVDNIINNIVKMVNAGVRNNVMLEITAQAESLGADAMFMEKVPTPMKKKTADLTGVKSKLHDAFGAAGIGELLAEVERESEVQARVSRESEHNIQLTDADLDDYIKTGKRLHTRNKKQRMLDNGKNPILTSETATKSFINDAIHGKAGGEVRAFGKVGKRLAALISAARRTLDLNGKYIEINADDIREAYKRHSSPKEKGDIPLTDNDFENIPKYLNDIDGVLSVNTYNEKVEIHLFKELEDGYVRILTVSSLERESLQVTKLIGVSKDKFESKYGAKKERDTGSLRGQTDKTDIPNPSTKAQHTAGALSTISIPQEKENVNKKFSTNSSEGKNGAKSEVWSKVDEIIESTIDDVLIQYGQGKAHGDVVTVLRNGKQEFWKINDALLLESLTNMSQKKMKGIMEAYAVVSRFMTSNCSQGKYGMYCFEAFCFLIEKYIPVLIIL